MYLLDTDTMSLALRPRPHEGLMAKLQATPRDLQYTSAISLAELLYGVERRGALGLRVRIEELVARLPILPFDEAAARIFAPIRADLERRGTPLADADLRIASIALANRLIVVTNNVRHFGRIPSLTVENWLAT